MLTEKATFHKNGCVNNNYNLHFNFAITLKKIHNHLKLEPLFCCYCKNSCFRIMMALGEIYYKLFNMIKSTSLQNLSLFFALLQDLSVKTYCLVVLMTELDISGLLRCVL